MLSVLYWKTDFLLQLICIYLHLNRYNFVKYMIKSFLFLNFNAEAYCAFSSWQKGCHFSYSCQHRPGCKKAAYFRDAFFIRVYICSHIFEYSSTDIYSLELWLYLFYISGLIASGRSYRDKQILVFLKQKILLLLPVIRMLMC